MGANALKEICHASPHYIRFFRGLWKQGIICMLCSVFDGIIETVRKLQQRTDNTDFRLAAHFAATT